MGWGVERWRLWEIVDSWEEPLMAKGSHEGFSVTEALRKADDALQPERGKP